MEEEIEEKLEQIYLGIISVKFRQFGVYDIFLTLKGGQVISVVLYYDCKNTFERNLTNAIMKIDKELVQMYKRL